MPYKLKTKAPYLDDRSVWQRFEALHKRMVRLSSRLEKSAKRLTSIAQRMRSAVLGFGVGSLTIGAYATIETAKKLHQIATETGNAGYILATERVTLAFDALIRSALASRSIGVIFDGLDSALQQTAAYVAALVRWVDGELPALKATVRAVGEGFDFFVEGLKIFPIALRYAFTQIRQGVLNLLTVSIDLVAQARAIVPAALERRFDRLILRMRSFVAPLQVVIDGEYALIRADLEAIDVAVSEVERQARPITRVEPSAPREEQITRDTLILTWWQALGERIEEVLRSDEMINLQYALQGMLIRGAATLSRALDEIAELAEIFRRDSSVVATQIQPVADVGQAMAHAFSLVALHAETIAVQNSIVAKALQKARLVVIAIISLIKSIAEIAKGIAAITRLDIPTAILHFAAATLYQVAAVLAILGAIGAIGPKDPIATGRDMAASMVSDEVEDGEPSRYGIISVRIEGDVYARDPGWIAESLIPYVALGGRRRARGGEEELPAIAGGGPDIGDALLQQGANILLPGIGGVL